MNPTLLMLNAPFAKLRTEVISYSAIKNSPLKTKFETLKALNLQI